MLDSSTFRWFLRLPGVVINVPGHLLVYLSPYQSAVAAVLEANRDRDRRRLKRELRKFHARYFAA
jgi:hypothetical protein